MYNKKTNIIVIVLIIVLIISNKYSRAQDSIQVQIKIDELEKTPILLLYIDSGESRYAKGIEINHNDYLFQLPNNGYSLIDILVNNSKNLLITESSFITKPMSQVLVSPYNKTSIIIKNGNQFDLEIVSKDKEVNLFEKYAAQEREYYRQSWDNLKKKKDGLTISKEIVPESLEKVKQTFIKKNKNSFAALAVFSSYYTRISASDAMKQLNTLAPKYPNASIRLTISEKLNSTLQTTTGNKVPFFQIKDINGNIFRSDNFSQRYLLIDFWGSWCQPCRTSHPDLKKMYDKYKPMGFEILGIAQESGEIAQQTKNWKKAIEEDEINWINVLNSPKNDLVKKFGITSYPTKILVDSEGNIIYRSGQNEGNLEQILEQLFK